MQVFRLVHITHTTAADEGHNLETVSDQFRWLEPPDRHCCWELQRIRILCGQTTNSLKSFLGHCRSRASVRATAHLRAPLPNQHLCGKLSKLHCFVQHSKGMSVAVLRILPLRT